MRSRLIRRRQILGLRSFEMLPIADTWHQFRGTDRDHKISSVCSDIQSIVDRVIIDRSMPWCYMMKLQQPPITCWDIFG